MSIVPGRDVPEVPQAWVDAVNKAVNDANHRDQCACDGWPAACVTGYRPGRWDLGVDLDIAVGALEPLIRENSAGAERGALAELLAATVRDLQAHIEARALELAEPQIRVVVESFSERAAELEHMASAQKQRDDDLIAELRRQLDAAVKSRDREFDELKRLRATVHRVRYQVRCWQDEDGRWCAFRDDLHAALDGEVEAAR